MPAEKIPALGWENCLKLSNEHAELVITLDVGPRILSYQATGGANVLRANPDQLGTSAEERFIERGGHRFWVAPETDRTYAADNAPVKFQITGPNSVRLENVPTAPWHMRKEMTVSLAADSTSVVIEHRATNDSDQPVSLASWGLTIMAPGGVEIIPQPPLGEHGKEFLPNRVMVPWTYTDLSDPRWKLGRRFITLRPKPGTPPTKIGLSHRERWAGYILPHAFFVKTIDYQDGALYPDLGCNFETFSKGDFIELEALSPLKNLTRGDSIGHTETWHLFPISEAPATEDEAALEKWLAPYLSKVGLL